MHRATLSLVLVVAVAALCLPAVASADQWADNGKAIGAGVHIGESYEGFVQFNAGAVGTFGCDVTMLLDTEGPTSAFVTTFTPTTSTCKGTVAFAGCKAIADSTKTPWHVDNALTPLLATGVGGNVAFNFSFQAGSCAGKQTQSFIEFLSVRLAVEGTNPITKLTISGTATSGISISGSLTPEFPAAPTLGIVN
jgi:hypothetical protein